MGAELVIRRSSIPVYRENFAVVIVSYIEQGIDEIGKFNCVIFLESFKAFNAVGCCESHDSSFVCELLLYFIIDVPVDVWKVDPVQQIHRDKYERDNVNNHSRS